MECDFADVDSDTSKTDETRALFDLTTSQCSLSLRYLLAATKLRRFQLTLMVLGRENYTGRIILAKFLTKIMSCFLERIINTLQFNALVSCMIVIYVLEPTVIRTT